MRKNISAGETGRKSGESLIYAAGDWMRRIEEFYAEFDYYDGFTIQNYTKALIEKVAVSTIDKTAPSILEIARTHCKKREHFLPLLEVIAELDDELRQFFADNINEMMVVTAAAIPFDTKFLVVETTYFGRSDETGFERYIETRRREGEVVHSELDRWISQWRADGDPTQVFLRHRHCL
jgi:hypothetical protein